MFFMYERDPRFAKFSAKVKGKKVSWTSKEPYLTGDPELIGQIHDELSEGLDFQIVALGEISRTSCISPSPSSRP